MTKTAIFSISSNDYLNQAVVSLESFIKNCSYNIDVYNLSLENIKSLKKQSFYINDIFTRYDHIDQNILRWSLKPSIILYFLLDLNYDKCIYIDNDIYFVNNCTFLINDINKGILLTKHHRPIVPNFNSKNNYQFICNFTDGFFNAGFIGANQNAAQALYWWHLMNLWKCEKNKYLGLFDDQKYLDILALNFNSVIDICDHAGCNLALWNRNTLIRSYSNDNWKINNNFDPIFCHFSGINLHNYTEYKNYDPMLFSYYEQFINKIYNAKQNSFHNFLHK
jgi:hypothetical protein